MYFHHAPEIWRDFPQLEASLLFVEGISPEVEVEASLNPLLERARVRLDTAGTESQLDEVSAWRRAYSQMGLKPTKYRSAAEALLRRFRREDDIPRLHPLVDLCNATSLAYALPVAVFDLAYVSEFLMVRYASGHETYLAFNGETEVIPAGEVVFADAEDHVHARRWTFRQSRQSTVTSETERVLIVSEGLHETAAHDVPALISSLAEAISAIWTAPKNQVSLSAEAPRFVW